MLCARALRLALALTLLLPSLPAAADVCENYDDTLHWLPYGDAESLLGQAILVADGHAYVEDGFSPYGGLHVFDLGDPDRPVVVGELADIGTPLAAHGGLLTCDGSDHRVQLVDVSDPSAPVLLGSSVELVHELAADGALAVGIFHSAGPEILRVFDAAGPGGPTLLAELTLGAENVSSLVMSGDLAYLRYDGASARLQPVSLADPANPVLLAPVPDGDATLSTLLLQGDRLYTYGNWSLGASLLQILDTGDPEHPSVVGSLELPTWTGVHLAARGGHLLLAILAGFHVVDIADEAAPVSVGWMSNPFWVGDVALLGSRAYLVGVPYTFEGYSTSSWLRVADLSSNLTPEPVGELALSSYGCIATQGPLAYTAAGGVLDVTSLADPTQPVAVGATTFDGTCAALLLDGSRAYLLSKIAGEMHLLGLDLSNPVAPLVDADLPLPYPAGGAMALRGDRLYLGLAETDFTTAFPRLCTVDVADPVNPVLLSSLNAGPYGFPKDLLISEGGQYLFFATDYYFTDLAVFSLADPDLPAPAGAYDVEGTLQAAALKGDLLVASAHEGHGIVTLLDVGDPLHVTTLSTLSIAMAGWDILLGGSVPDGMVYLCSEAEGLTACSIADPSAPVEMGSYHVAMRHMADGGGFAVGVRSPSLVTAPFLCAPTGVAPAPAPRPALSAHPNPFNPSTELRFALDAAGPVQLSIHDIAGRRVRTLLAGVQPAGELRATWDGRDDAGQALASGVYLARLEATGGAASRKLVLLK